MGWRPVKFESKTFFLGVRVSKIILIVTRGISVNYANLRGICEIFPLIFVLGQFYKLYFLSGPLIITKARADAAHAAHAANPISPTPLRQTQ
jgi:hypothetical protein